MVDVCDDTKYWSAEIKSLDDDEDAPPLRVITPSEFFTPNGAEYTDYDKSNGEYVKYKFIDYSCQTDNFEVEWNYEFNRGSRDSIVIVLAVTIEPEDDLSFLDQLRSGKDEESNTRNFKFAVAPDTSKGDRLRKEDGGNTKFVVKNNLIYYYNDDNLSRVEKCKICKIRGLWVEFPIGGGRITDISFRDQTNGTSWYEDFSDCSNVNLFPNCPPPEPEVLEISAKTPTCENSDFVLDAQTNLDPIKWVGPDGFTAEGTNLLIPYDEAPSGCYIAYGRRDRCSPYVYKKICVDIPVLNVNAEVNSINLCQSEKYVWGDTVLTTSGLYTKHTIDPQTGCDKVEIVKLKVHKTHVDLYETLCYGTTTMFNGEIIGDSGDYTTTVSNTSNTCDSTTVLHVDVLPQIPFTYKDSTLCYGEEWFVAGRYLRPGRSLPLIYKTEDGCDSVVVFTAKNRPLDYTVLEEKQFCENTEVEAFGQIYTPTQDTTIQIVTENEFGCKHYETQPLVMVPKIDDGITVDTLLCYEDKLVMPNGDQYTKPVSFKYKYESKLTGCDSIVTYNLSFRKQDIVIKDTVFLCEEGGMNRFEKIRRFETNEFGCKRTIETPVLHRNISKTVQYLEICYDERVTVFNKEYTKSGEYKDTLVASNGCDSIITTHLTILPKREQILEETIVCSTEKTGRDTIEVKTDDADKCPLYVRTPILYQEPKTETIDTSLCAGYTIEVAGRIYDKSGEYEIHTTAKNSCDSTIYLKLTIGDMIVKDLYDTICFEDVYKTRKATYTETGDYTEKYTSETACDTIINIHLFKRDIMEDVRPTILKCEDDTTKPLTADYVDEFEEIDGKTLCTIHIKQPYHFEYTEYKYFEKEICFEESHTDSRGKIYNTPGDYTIKDTFNASTGCLSVQTTYLTIDQRRENLLPEERICHKTKSGRDTIITKLDDGDRCPLYEIQPQLFLNPTKSTIDTFICSNKSLTVADRVFNAEGIYTVITTASNGCDSTITVNLGINQVRTIVSYDTICANENFVTEQNVYTESGVYTETYADYDENKCDEIHEIHLFVRDEMRDTLATITECKPAGTEGVFLDKVEFAYSQPDIRTGCEVSVYQPFHYAFEKLTEDDVTICEGTSYTVNGIDYNTGGEYSVLLRSAEGCDSTYKFFLTVELMERRDLDSTLLCSRENVGMKWNKLDTVPSETSNCPRIDITPTRNIPIYDIYLDTTVCSGKTIEFEGNTYTSAGEKKVVLTAQNGCDSVRHLTINYINPKETNLNIHLCSGETHVSSIKSYNTSGHYIERLSDVNGCDSIAYLYITVEPLEEKHLPKVTFCETDSIKYHGKTYTTNAVHIDTLFSKTGCPIYHYTDIVTDKEIPYVEKEYSLCEGERRYINAFPTGMDGIKYQWSPSTYLEKIQSGSTYVAPAQSINYTVTMTKGKCKTQGLVKVNVLERPKIKEISVDKQTQVATIIATGGRDMMYYCEDLNHESPNNEIVFEKPGGYDVKVVDETGCYDSLHFFYAPPVFPETYFVADSEGDEALWQIKGLEAYDGFEIWIYDRWGKLLKHYKNNFTGWDGRYNGHRMPSTDYWYIISIDLGEIELSGHFTLLRN